MSRHVEIPGFVTLADLQHQAEMASRALGIPFSPHEWTVGSFDGIGLTHVSEEYE